MKIKEVFQKHMVNSGGVIEFDPHFKDKVWNEISKYQDNGIIRYSLKAYSKDIDIITRNRIRELSNSLSREYGVSIYITDMTYTPEITVLDLSNLNYALDEVDLSKEMIKKCRELGIMNIEDKYKEPYLEHDLAIEVKVSDAVMASAENRSMIQKLIAILTLKGNVIIDTLIGWDPIVKAVYDQKLDRVLRIYASNPKYRGNLGLIFNKVFNINEGEPIVTTVFEAIKYLNSISQIRDFTYPAIPVAGNRNAETVVDIVEAYYRSTTPHRRSYNFEKIEREVSSINMIKQAIYSEYPLMINMNEISSFLHPTEDFSLPNIIVLNCKYLDWRQ